MRARGPLDFGICLSAALVWTWPYAARLTTPLRDLYDGQGLLWVVSWVRHALVHEPSRLFQANALAPARDVLAFSEPLLGYGVLGVPLGWLGLSDVGVFNALCLLGTAFTPWAVSRLSLELGVPRPAAVLGALIASFSALTVAHLGFVSFVASGGIALAVAAWLRLGAEGGRRNLFVLGLAVAGLGYFSLQLLAFTLAALFFLEIARVIHARAIRGLHLPEVLAAFAIAGLLLAPLALPLLRARRVEGLYRSVAETDVHSARPRDFLSTTSYNPGQAFLPFREDAERALYPGTLALALSVLGLATWRRRRDPPGLGAWMVGAGLVVVGALGALGHAGPLYPLLSAVAPPLFGGIRAAARFAFVMQVGFGLLAGLGAAFLLARERAASRNAVAGLLVLAAALELRQTVPFDRHPETPHPPVEDFLAQADVGGPILHLPSAFTISNDASLLVASTRHWKPIVNGVTSHVPPRFFELAELLSRAPIPQEAWTRLKDWPVAAIVLHEGRIPLERRASTLRFLAEGVAKGELGKPLVFPHRGSVDALFSVVRVRGERPFGPGGGGDPEANAAALAELADVVAAAPGLPAKEDPSFPASIDSPADGATVSGSLVVRGWSQTAAGPADVLEMRIDGCRRIAMHSRRTPRPDVGAALPALGSVTHAGYEETFEFLPGDEGAHDIAVRFRSPEGAVRTLSTTFVWK